MRINASACRAFVAGALAATAAVLPATAATAVAAPVARPAPVHRMAAFDTGQAVRLTWTNPTDPLVAGVTVRYARGRTAPDSPAAGTGVPLRSALATSARLTGLTPGTRYTAAVWTYDAGHRYSRAAVSRFTTLPAAPATATVSGTITDTGHRPLAGVEVYVETLSAAPGHGTATDAAGHYTVTVSPDAYYLGFDGALATGGNSDATGYIGDVVSVDVHAGEELSGVDAILHPGAVITGRVSDAAGHPLAGVLPAAIPVVPYVDVTGLGISYSFGPTITEPSSVNGRFSLRGMPRYPLRICLDPTLGPVTGGSSDRAGYVGRCSSRAVIPTIGAGRDIGDQVLSGSTGGLLVGTVRDAAGAPVEGAFVLARGADDASFDSDGYGYTRADGSYRIAVGPGRYEVCAAPGSGGSAGPPQCAPRPVSVSTGGRTRVDIRLAPGGGAAGRVLDPDGHPLAGADVTLEPTDRRSNSFGHAQTDANGQFVVTGLAPQAYVACYRPAPVASTAFPTGIAPRCDRQTQVEVRAGAVRLGVDARLRIGGALTGHVTDDLGAPVEDTYVLVESRAYRYGASVPVAPDGSYTVAGLPSGTYHVCSEAFSVSGTDVSRCYGGPPGEFFGGTPVPVTVGTTTTGIDIVLDTGGSVAVTVRDADGAPLGGVDVAVVQQCEPHGFCARLPLLGSHVVVAASDTTDADGTLTIGGLAAGQYAVCAFAYYGATASGHSATGYVDSCGATPFDVTVTNHETTDVSRDLATAGQVAGTVTDAQGRPLAGARVSVSHAATSDYGADVGFLLPAEVAGPIADTFTDSRGRFAIHGVQPGGQTVCVDASRAAGHSAAGYLDTCLGGPTRKTATPIEVEAGRSARVQLALQAGAAISGAVTNPAGRGVEAVVVAFDDAGHVVSAGPTARDGSYRMSALPAGTYRVCFYAFRYTKECWRDVPWSGRRHVPAAARTIVLRAGEERRSVDAVVDRAPHVKPA